MKMIQIPEVHAASLVANSGNTAYGVDVITHPCLNFDLKLGRGSVITYHVNHRMWLLPHA